MENISLDVKTNWALKLANLRRLKKSLDKYLEEELKMKNNFNQIDLPLIARTSDIEEIIKLFQCVLFVVVNCPQKTVYVRRIMELDESVQMQLMYFIQKVMGESEKKPSKENESHKKELEHLKNENKKFADQISELEEELLLAHEEYAILRSDFTAVNFENERLRLEIDKKSGIEAKETNIMEMELRSRINEKDESISELKKALEKNKKRYETEIIQIKDELDIASSKLVEALNMEKMMAQYKKRVESFGNMKFQVDDMTKTIESLNSTINRQNEEIEGLLKIKHSYISMKEALDKEKSKTESLSFNLDAKEKLIRKLEKTNYEYRQKVDLLSRQNEELMAADYFPESSHASDDSFNRLDKESIPIIKERIKAFPSVSQGEQLENLNSEIRKQTALIELKKTKLKKLKEILKMVGEDSRSKIIEVDNFYLSLHESFEKLQSDNVYLSEEIQKLNDALQEKDTELFAQRQIIEDLEELKASKASSLDEMKNLSIEKEELLRQMMGLNEKISDLSSTLSLKDRKIQELNNEIKAANQQIHSFKDREALFGKEILSLKSEPQSSSDLSDKIIELEKENIEYRTQISMFNNRIEEKNQRILELTKENKTVSEEYKQKFAKVKEDYDKELLSKNDEMIKQTEEATGILLKQKEQLAARLQSERRNTILNFSRAMSTRDTFATSSKEVFKLRELLMQKEKEISRMNRNYKELKNCWKQTAKLLKAVWKELGKETEKIEEAVRERLSL